MTLILGMDNATAHRMLKRNGQALTMVVPGAPSVVNPVTGAVTASASTVVPMYGFPFPVSSQYAAYYGFSSVEEKDAFFFIEAIVEPKEGMKLVCNGETFNVVKAQSITKAGIAKLFIVQVRK